MHQETMAIPRTRQGVRDLDRVKGRVIPFSGGPPSPATGDVNVGESERLLSAVAGTIVALLGLRGGMMGIAALVAGGSLLYRGVTGHCSLYKAMGLNTAGPSSREETAEVVDRPG